MTNNTLRHHEAYCTACDESFVIDEAVQYIRHDVCGNIAYYTGTWENE